MKSILPPEDLPVRRSSPDHRDLTQARLGDSLKTMFEGMTSEPMPDRLVQLALALEDAFQRGELFERRSLDS